MGGLYPGDFLAWHSVDSKLRCLTARLLLLAGWRVGRVAKDACLLETMAVSHALPGVRGRGHEHDNTIALLVAADQPILSFVWSSAGSGNIFNPYTSGQLTDWYQTLQRQGERLKSGEVPLEFLEVPNTGPIILRGPKKLLIRRDYTKLWEQMKKVIEGQLC